jgi:predicted transcriptional regulator
MSDTGVGNLTKAIDLPDLAEIRVIRRQLGWTQHGLARATGLSQSFINKIERSEADPGYRTAKKIFQTLQDGLAKKKRPAENKTAHDIMATNVEYVTSSQTVEEARKLMIRNDFSQLPVMDNGIVKGSITDRLLVRQDGSDRQSKVRDVMERKFPVVDPDTKLETLRHLLDEYHAVLVDKGNKEYGIVTKHDILKSMK